MNKKLIFSILISCLVIGLLSPLLIKDASAAYIFSDGFESGNLNAWSMTYGTISLNSQTVNSGAYSIQSILVGNDENTYYHVLGNSLPNPIYLREYVYINSTTIPSANGDYYEVGGFSTSDGGNYGDGEICIFNVAGTLYWGVYYRDPSSWNGFSHVISSDNTTASATRVSLGWNCVELKHTTPPFNTQGGEQLFLNGVSILEITPYNYDRTPYSVTIPGSQIIASSTESWNYYIDDVVVSDSYIGPLQHQLTMSTNYGTVSPASSLRALGETITINATAPAAELGERYIWQGWIGSGIGSYTGPNPTPTITIGSNITQQAVWEHDYYLTVTSPNGTTTGSGWYVSGSSVFASVSPLVVAGSPGTQYVFTNWGSDASGTSSPSNAIIMNAPKTATANWKTQYYLTVSSSVGTVGGTGYYDSGTTANATLNSLTVAGASGTQYVFTGWSGSASGTTTPSNNIIMNSPRTAIANWQTQYNLTFKQLGVGQDYTGNLLTVNGTTYNTNGYSTWANANSAYTFSYSPQAVVSDTTTQYLLTGVTGNTTLTSINVVAPTTVTASYSTQYYLTVSSQYDSPSPTSKWYDNNTSVNAFVSSPASGYTCSGWSGTGSVPSTGSSSATTFAITAPSTITWNWYDASATPTPTAAPTPTVAPTANPTTSPTVTPTHAPTPSPTPIATSSPKPTPTQSSTDSTGNSANNLYIYGGVIAIVIVGIVVATLLFMRRAGAKKGLP